MWKPLLALVACSVALAAPVPKELKKEDDKARIAGAWAMTRCNVSERDIQASWNELTFAADGGVKATHDGKPVFEYATTLDPTPTPRRMPWRDKQSGAVMYECVYEFTADGLTIVVPHDNKVIPASLKTGPKVTVYEFKRVEKK